MALHVTIDTGLIGVTTEIRDQVTGELLLDYFRAEIVIGNALPVVRLYRDGGACDEFTCDPLDTNIRLFGFSAES